jgi:hypothetical protein
MNQSIWLVHLSMLSSLFLSYVVCGFVKLAGKWLILFYIIQCLSWPSFLSSRLLLAVEIQVAKRRIVLRRPRRQSDSDEYGTCLVDKRRVRLDEVGLFNFNSC